MAFDQLKKINEIKKAQKELAKEIIEVEAGDGVVVIQFTGEMKIKKVTIDPEMVDKDNIEDLEHYVKIAVRDGLAKTQEVMANKMKPFIGMLGM